jgi:uncharacterized protein (TIGR03067 family)
MRRLCIIFGLSLGLAAGGCASDRAAKRADVQGRWRAVAAERNGAPAPDLMGHELAFTGDRFRITSNGRLLFGGSYTIDRSARPSRIDFRQEEGETLRGTWRGIYRIERGALEIADNAPDMSKPAPVRFSTWPDSGYVLVRFVPN